MAKWELVDDDKAPENLSGMSDDAKTKLEMLRALVPGKTLVQTVETTKQQGFKAALTRIAGKQGMSVEVWSNGDKVCVRLKPATPADQSAAESGSAD